MLRAYIYKILRSPLTYVGILGTVFICSTHIMTNSLSNSVSVLYHMDLFFGLDQTRKPLTLFAALPFVGNFAEEWESGVSTQCAARCGVKKYLAANVVLCAAVSFLTVLIGMFLFAWIYSFFIPFYEPNNNIDNYDFGYIAANGMPWLYYAIRVSIYALSVAMWCMTGLLLSALLPNKFVAVCTPLVTSYVVERFTIGLPGDFNLWYLSLGRLKSDNEVFKLIYIVGVFLLLSAALGSIFWFIAEKRLQNEFT